MRSTARAALAAAMITAATSSFAQEPPPAPPADGCNALCQLVRGIGGDRNPPGSGQAAAPAPVQPAPAAPVAIEAAEPKPVKRQAAQPRRTGPEKQRGPASVAGQAVRTGPAEADELSTSAVRETPAGPAAYRGAATTITGAGKLRVLMGPDETLRPVLADLGDALAPALKVEAVRGGAPPLKDLLSLPGVDMAIVSAPMLANAGQAAEKLVYVAKLFGQELHVVARQDVRTIEDLVGKPVFVGAPGGDTELVARALLQKHGVEVTPAPGTLAEALSALKEGRIAAVVALAPKPLAALAELDGAGGLHLVPVSFTGLGESYDPASFSSADYPGLVPAGERVETAAVDAVLIAPWWRESSPRQQELTVASKILFERFPELLKDGRHPKWKETNLAAVVDGRRRLKMAEQWVQVQMRARRASGDRSAIAGQ